MTMYSLPDLSGKDPNYLQVNIPFHIYANNIKLHFENSPVFASSIRIVLSDGSGMVLVKDQHYKIDSTNIDEAAMSRAYLEDDQFNDLLVKSVTIISSAVVGKRVAVNVQQFYDTIPGRNFDDGAPLQFTPALAKSLISGLADARQQLSKPVSQVTPITQAPQLLPLDINCEKSGNVITNEKIIVNTVAGGKIIALVQGAFFADSLVITKDGVPLNKNTDYLPIMPSPLISQSTNKSGIYRFILLAKEFTGEIKITYHALGGEVQQKDVSQLYDMAASVKTFLEDQIFVTAETIVETPAFRAIVARLVIQETNMRNLLSGTPTYGDANTGYTAIRRPIAATDSKHHWYTIANLYKVTGSTDVVLADQFKGRVFLPGAKVALSFTVDVNLNQTRNPVTFTTSNLVFDPLYTLFTDYSANAPVYPMLRVVWNNISDGLSGASLQIGLPLTALSDQMVVENMSSSESCWILDMTGVQVTGQPAVSPSAPRDTGFTLPDGSAVWSSVSTSARSRVHIPTYREGYLMYQGTGITLNTLKSANTEKPATPATSTKNSFNILLPQYFPLTNIKQLVVTMASSDAAAIYDIEIDLPVQVVDTKFGKRSFTDTSGERFNMSATVVQDVNGVTTVSLNINTTSNTPTDVVRYIRARV